MKILDAVNGLFGMQKSAEVSAAIRNEAAYKETKPMEIIKYTGKSALSASGS